MRLSEYSIDENDSQSSEEYIDFRTYPIPIDWEKIENNNEYFSILYKYGYFGVGLYSSLSKKCKISLDIEEYIASFLKHYWNAFSNKQQIDDLFSFIDSLPNLKSIKTLLLSEAILIKEKCLIKIVLDMYEKFYLKYDKPCYHTLNNEYLILAETFYMYCSEGEIKKIWNTLFNSDSNIKDKISKQHMLIHYINLETMKFKLSTTKEGYIKHLNRIKKNCAMLTKGTSLSKFIQ